MINFGSKAWFISHSAILATSYPTSGLHKNVRKISSFTVVRLHTSIQFCTQLRACASHLVVVCAEFSHVQRHVFLHDFFLESLMTPLILKSRRIKLHVYYPHLRDPRGCACALTRIFSLICITVIADWGNHLLFFFSFFLFLELAVLI